MAVVKRAFDKRLQQEIREHLKTRNIAEKYQTLLRALLVKAFKLGRTEVYCFESDIVFAFPVGTNMASQSVQALKKMIPQLVKIKSMRLSQPDDAAFSGEVGPQLIVSL